MTQTLILGKPQVTDCSRSKRATRLRYAPTPWKDQWLHQLCLCDKAYRDRTNSAHYSHRTSVNTGRGRALFGYSRGCFSGLFELIFQRQTGASISYLNINSTRLQLGQTSAGGHMARLNIEDQFFLEIGTIARKFADDDQAIGNAIRFFRYAQEKHKQGLFVPEDDFAALGFSEALFPLFAKRTEKGIQCAGADKHFGWLAAKIEAGRRGGSKPKQKQAKASKPKQTEPSSSSSCSSSSSSSESNSGSPSFEDCDGLKEPHAQATINPLPTEPSPTALVWRAYKQAYSERYHTDPTWNGKVAGQLKQFTTRVPAIEAPSIAAFFVTHNGARYVASGHAIGQMLIDAEKLRTEWQTGTKITSRDAQQAEFSDSLNNQIKRLGGVS